MLFVHLKTTSFFLQPKRSRSTIRYNWQKTLKSKEITRRIYKHKGRTHWNVLTFGRRGLLKSQYKTNRVLRIRLIQTFVKVFTYHELIHRIPMCAHSENCGFMRTYIPCNIESEGKVSLTKNSSKTRLNKRNTYLFKIVLCHFVYLYFFTSVRPLLSYIVKEVDIR